LLLACENDAAEPLLLHAMVAFPPKDTILLDLPAVTRHCVDGGALLLESLSPEGSGVLLTLRYRDSLTSDSFPIVPPSDITALPAAVVAIRFFIHDTPRGFALDSGTVHVRRDGNMIAARGGGVGIANAIRIAARIEYQDVPIGTDGVPCTYQP
jgi:hypothetical protein